MNSKKLKSIFYTVSAVLFWSTSATAFKLTLQGINFAQLLFFSSLFSFIYLFVTVSLTARGQLFNFLDKKYLIKNLVLGFTNPFLYYLILFKAYSILPAQEVIALNYTWPIAIAVFSALFLSHKLTTRILLGMLIAFSGVVIVAVRGDIFALKFQNITGVLLATGSSVVWASFWTLNLKDDRIVQVKLLGAFLVGTILSAAYLFFFESFKIQDPVYLLGTVYIGLFEMGLTFLLWLKGLELSPNKAKTSTLAYIAPFISLILVVIILGEKLLFSSVVGLLIIVSGIIIQNYKLGRKFGKV